MVKTEFEPGKFEIFEKDGLRVRVPTFAFDTETLTMLDGVVLPEKALRNRLKRMKTETIRKRLSIAVWAWQAFDEQNGFYMTNDFERFLAECGRRGYKFGWCYNATFDFAQIDYQLLSDGKWHPKTRGEGAYDKGEAWAYESTHNDMGTRYAYKIWAPYRAENRHVRVHAVEFRDFMKFLGGGLRKVLEDLKVTEADGVTPIRKLTMEYQAAGDWRNLSDGEIAYCRNDVAGLYFAVKKFDEIIAHRSGGECHIFGEKTNLMTAGGFAKRQLLRAMYPNKKDKKSRLSAYQKDHPITPEQDYFLRKNNLYRGGISFVNPAYKGKAITGRPMYRYDVNSEYPFSMYSVRDLIGKPCRVSVDDYFSWTKEEREKWECAFMLSRVSGEVRPGMLGVWYNPFKKDYVERVEEEGKHLMFERELNEMEEWYELDYTIDYCILWRRGDYAYRTFILQNYKNKSEAKNDSEKKEAKLELNSSYGKLSERLTRGTGHYEMNGKTGAVHFVHDGEEVDDGGRMNVAVGALVTSFARCYILSKIREICPVPARDFVYIDTDSIHCFMPYCGCDPKRLGALKLEATCPAIKYIAPKTYLDVETINPDGSIPFRGFEIHSKGVSIGSILQDLARPQKGKRKGLPTLPLLFAKMSYGAKYPVLMAMNVKGGKALVPCYKYLARPETNPDIVVANMEQTMLAEK